MNVQNLKPEACYKMIVTNKATAKAMLKGVIKFLGLAFHPDTPAESYVAVDSNKPTFEKFEAEFLNTNISNAFELLDDIYQESLEIWHEYGMIDTPTYNRLGGEKMTYDELMKQACEAIDKVISKLAEDSCNRAFNVIPDYVLNDKVLIHYLEEDGSHLMMDELDYLAKELFKLTGRHYCITNNSPTDGMVLVFVDPCMDVEFDKEHHKKSFIAQFEAWRTRKTEYGGPHSKAIVYQTLEDVIERECFGNRWQDSLKYNFEMWHQVMCMARNGISNPDAPCIFTHFLEDNDNG